MKKQKAGRKHGNPAKQRVKAPPQHARSTRIDPLTSLSLTSSTSRPNAIGATPSMVRGAATSVRYSRDDRQSLALLLAPFFILALSLAVQQTFRSLPMQAPTPEILASLPAAAPPASKATNPIASPAEVASPPAVVAMAPQPSVVPTAPSSPPIVAAPLIETPLPAIPPIALEPLDVASPVTVPPVSPPMPTGPRVVVKRPLPSLSPIVSVPPADVALPPLASIIPAPVPSLAAPAMPATADRERKAALAPVMPAPAIPVPSVTKPAGPTEPLVGDSQPAMQSNPAILLARPQVCEASPSVVAPLGSPLAKHIDKARFGVELAAAARAQLSEVVIYNAKYSRISYPMGDVAPLFGVCTDVIVRAYRALGIDLQQLIYTTKSGRGDAHIDHRRVEVVKRFLERHGEKLPISEFAEDYQPGDVVTYYRPQNRTSTSHIAVVSDVPATSGRYMIVHNRGWGPQLEDALFVDKITGHFRFSGLAPKSPEPVHAAVVAGWRGRALGANMSPRSERDTSMQAATLQQSSIEPLCRPNSAVVFNLPIEPRSELRPAAAVKVHPKTAADLRHRPKSERTAGISRSSQISN